MHQVGLIEEVPVELDVLRVLHQYMAGLADTGQQLVDRLRGVDHRIFWPDAVLAHGMVSAVEGMECRVRQPGLVKMQVVDVTVEHALDGFSVVQHTVVSGLRQCQHPRLDGFCVNALEQRVGRNLGANGFRLELALRDGADDAEVVARGLQEHRHRARHDDGVQDGLVAVAVHHHHIVRRHSVVPDHLVAGGRAVGHEKTVIGIEDARRIALAGANRAVVVQQLAQFFHRVADVGAQHVFTIKLVVHLADRAFQEGHAAGVTRAVPGVGAVFGVVQQRLEERRLYPFEVTFGFPQDVARHKFGRVLEHMDKTMQLAQDVVGDMARGFGLAIHINRHIQILAAHFFNEVAQVQHGRVQVRARGEFLIVDRQNKGAGAALLLRELRQVAVAGHAKHFKTLGLDGLRERTDTQARGVLGAEVFVNDDDGKTEFHKRGVS
ncbi:hypothetical protein D9M73_93800 [compost metagenome]